MSIIAKYKFDSSIYADLIPEFNAEFTSDLYTVTDEVDGDNSNHIIRTIESESLPTLMRFGSNLDSYVEGSELALLGVLDINTSELTSCYRMFRYCTKLTSLDVSNFNTSKVTDMRAMFYNCSNLTTLDISNWDTSNAIDVGFMFYGCKLLTTLDVSNWDTSSVTTMAYMFDGCKLLTTLNVSNWNTSNVTTMSHMFYNCSNLTTLNVSNWNTSNVTDMQQVFDMCYTLNVDVSNWDTSNVAIIYAMFGDCRAITSLDLTKWNTSKMTNMLGVFWGCINLVELDISSWDTSKVTNMKKMFYGCNNLTTLDVSNFDTSNVTDITEILYDTTLLTDIGMLYCDQSTIETIASLLPTDTTQTIWVEDVDVKDLTPVEGVEFKQYAKNTEIMLTSPLLEGDKLIVKDGKLYHYHKMGKVVFDGSEDWKINNHWVSSSYRRFHLIFNINGNWSSLKSNKFKTIVFDNNIDNQFTECISCYDTGAEIVIQKNNILTLDEFKQWLQQNPTTVVYELETPYYELISEDPLTISLIAESSDITNSSNIPLNMTINNKGLSTVAMSPSTTYTVAFDKDTDSEVVVNLCGNEVTTTDNIVEITTPSEIDDELIFYGDGIEMSNVRLLEGSVSEDSVPRETFEGLKNSFEDGYISENMVNDNRYCCVITLPEPDGVTHFEEMYVLSVGNRVRSDLIEVKPNTVYTVRSSGYIVTIHEYNSDKIWIKDHLWQDADTYTFSTTSDGVGLVVYIKKSDNSAFTEDEADSVPIMLLTEEDFNNLGKYKVEYKVIGKNKFDKVRFVEFNKDLGWQCDIVTYNNKECVSIQQQHYQEVDILNSFNLNRKKTYSISFKWFFEKSNEDSVVALYVMYTDGTEEVKDIYTTEASCIFTTKENLEIERMYIGGWQYSGTLYLYDFQIEEGTQVTSYEPYKSYIKTFYLNSPLLEGDTIEDVNGVATHVHRYEKVVLDGSDDEFWNYYEGMSVGNTFNAYINKDDVMYNQIPICSTLPDGYYDGKDTEKCSIGGSPHIQFQINKSKLSTSDLEGVKEWFKNNPAKIVYRLASPIYEPISTESILCDSYVNGHLDFDTNVPIEKIEFKYNWLPLKYTSTQSYTVQFEADNDGFIDNWTIEQGNTKFNTQVRKGINKFTVNGGDTKYPSMYFSGIGFNASNIQVVATDRDVDFGYFKGLQSSFESELVTDEADENYGKYKVECKVTGKNKFNKSNVVLGYWGIDSTTYYTNIPSVFSHKTPIKVKPNTWYTIQSLGVAGNVYVVGLHPYENICVVNNSRISFYTNNRTEVYIQINTENIDLSKFLDIIQLEEGTQATEYEPYQEYTKTIYLNSPLLKGDTIEVHNGKLCHYHKMGMVVLDGSESWDTSNNLDMTYRFSTILPIDSKGTTTSADYIGAYSISNNFICDNNSTYDRDEECYQVGNITIGSIYIRISKSKLSSLNVNGFKQWLQANPTTVVYELETPYYELIEPTQEDLIITSVKEGDLHIDTIVPISSKVTYNVNVQLLTDFEQSIVEQVQATQTTDLQSILDEEIDN